MQENPCCQGQLHICGPFPASMCPLRSLPAGADPFGSLSQDGFLPPLFTCFAVFPRHFSMRFPHGLTYYYYTLSRLFSGYILYFFCLSFCASCLLSFFVFYHKYKSAESLLFAFFPAFCSSHIFILEGIVSVQIDGIRSYRIPYVSSYWKHMG